MNNIKEKRVKKGFSQKDLAVVMGVGQSTVAMWENGSNMPRSDKLLKLAGLLECTVEELLTAEKTAS